MAEDDVLQQVRLVREQLAQRYGFDLNRLVEALRELDNRGDRPIIRIEERPESRSPQQPVQSIGSH
jgi:hypothetical protein